MIKNNAKVLDDLLSIKTLYSTYIVHWCFELNINLLSERTSYNLKAKITPAGYINIVIS